MIDVQGRPVITAPTAIGARNPLIEQWIVETCTKCGYPELAERLTYEISADPFFRRSWRVCYDVLGGVDGLNAGFAVLPHVLDVATPTERLSSNLVIHETCHILANHVAGRDVQHDEPWRRLMHQCGQPPWTNVFTP